MDKLVYLARARAAAVDAARANGVDPGRLRVDFPDALSFARSGPRPTVLARLEVEGGGAVPIEASAVAEAAAPMGAGRRCRAMASGGGYSGPLVYRDGEGMRPDVAAAFDRMAAAAPRRRRLAAGRLRLPLRRRTGGAVRRPSRPDVGRAARSLAAPLRDRARPRSRRRLRLARRQRRPLRLRPALLAGRPGTTATTPARRPARPPATRSAAAPGDGGAARRRAGGATPARPSSRPASARRCSPPPPTGTSPRPCSPAQLMAESNFNPFAGLARPAPRASPSSCPAPRASYGLARPLRPGRRDRRPGPPDVGPDRASSARPNSPSPPTTPAPPRSKPATASRPTPRPRPTSPASSPCSAGPARWSRRASRCGWWRETLGSVHARSSRQASQ